MVCSKAEAYSKYTISASEPTKRPDKETLGDWHDESATISANAVKIILFILSIVSNKTQI